MNEIWKEVEGFNGEYLISNLGNIKSNKNKKEILLKTTIDKCGYIRVGLRKEGKQYCYTIHRLVASAFIPNLENKKQVNHIDCNKRNNNVENLEWTTPSENIIHAWKNGLREYNRKVISERLSKINKENKTKKIFSTKLNLSFDSIKLAGIYLQEHYFSDKSVKNISNNIAKILVTKSSDSIYDFGWVQLDK